MVRVTECPDMTIAVYYRQKSINISYSYPKLDQKCPENQKKQMLWPTESDTFIHLLQVYPVLMVYQAPMVSLALTD